MGLVRLDMVVLPSLRFADLIDQPKNSSLVRGVFLFLGGYLIQYV